MIRRLSVVVLCSLALACGRDEPRLSVATSGTVFDRGGTGTVPEAVVSYTIVNRGERTAFLYSCGERITAAVERLRSGGWEQYMGEFCLYSSPQRPGEIPAGGRATSSVVLREAGRYRLRVSYDDEASRQAPKSVLSAPFTVR